MYSSLYRNTSTDITWKLTAPTRGSSIKHLSHHIAFKATSCAQSYLLFEHIEHSMRTFAALLKPKSDLFYLAHYTK